MAGVGRGGGEGGDGQSEGDMGNHGGGDNCGMLFGSRAGMAIGVREDIVFLL